MAGTRALTQPPAQKKLLRAFLDWKFGEDECRAVRAAFCNLVSARYPDAQREAAAGSKRKRFAEGGLQQRTPAPLPRASEDEPSPSYDPEIVSQLGD